VENKERPKLYAAGGIRLHLADELFDDTALCGVVAYPLTSDPEPRRFEGWPCCSNCLAAERKLA
jgi:hypothetical protein